MKILTKAHVRHKGEMNKPGTELIVEKEIGETLVANGFAEAVEEQDQEPEAPEEVKAEDQPADNKKKKKKGE